MVWFSLFRYVPSNYVKKEKKSIFDKLLSRKLPFSSNSNGHSASHSHNHSSSTVSPISSPPAAAANGVTKTSPTNQVQVIKYNANKSTAETTVLASTVVSNGNSSQTSRAAALVKHKYQALKPDELTLNIGVRVNILEKFGDGWWRVNVVDNESQAGLYPSNYLQEEPSPLTTSPQSDNSHNLSTAKSPVTTTPSNGHGNYESPHIKNGGKYESLSSNERDIEFVRVIYPHTAAATSTGQNAPDYVNGDQVHPGAAELTVTVNEVLKLIEDDNEGLDFDKSWVKVFNSQGVTGMIPSSCVQPIIADSNGGGGDFVFIRRPTCIGMFANQPWYYGNISRVEANTLLNKYGQNGDFILRDSEREVSS